MFLTLTSNCGKDHKCFAYFFSTSHFVDLCGLVKKLVCSLYSMLPSPPYHLFTSIHPSLYLPLMHNFNYCAFVLSYPSQEITRFSGHEHVPYKRMSLLLNRKQYVFFAWLNFEKLLK